MYRNKLMLQYLVEIGSYYNGLSINELEQLWSCLDKAKGIVHFFNTVMMNILCWKSVHEFVWFLPVNWPDSC